MTNTHFNMPYIPTRIYNVKTNKNNLTRYVLLLKFYFNTQTDNYYYIYLFKIPE